jgi:hypothetical protein
MIETLKKYDKLFAQNYSHGNENSLEIFKYSNRNSNLILTAPHSTRSFCNKKEKNADLYTGALVKYLGEENGISTIIRTKFTPYKALISDWIAQNKVQQHYFLDIHGFNQDIDYDICLGIGEFEENGYPYLQEIMQIAKKYGLKTIVNHPNYCGLKGLTGRYQKIFNLPNVIQMEIKKEFRDFFSNPEVVKNTTIPFLTEVINLYL